jgi:hypothetical protein
MNATEEIAIKLGLKTGDLKAALADVGASIKKLKKDGEDSNVGFLKSFNEFKRGFRDMKDVIMGAGVVQAILGINEAAQKFAENYKGAFDENVAATLRLKLHRPRRRHPGRRNGEVRDRRRLPCLRHGRGSGRAQQT